MRRRDIIFLLPIFSSFFCNAQTWNWVRAETPNVDPFTQQHLIACDDSGNVYFSGNEGAVGLSKYDNNGNLKWSNLPVSFSSFDWSHSVAESSGNEFIAGEFKNVLILGKDTLRSLHDTEMFIVKYNAGGGELWAKMSTGNNALITGESVSADYIGNSYVTGYFKGTLIFGTDTFYAPYQSVYLVKYDPSGNYLWAKTGICPLSGFAGYSNAVWADSIGESFITGYYRGYMIFGTDTLTSTVTFASDQVFAAKFDVNGNIVWLFSPKLNINSSATYGYSVSADNIGSTYLTGTAGGKFMINYDTVNAIGTFFAKFNAHGSLSWIKQCYPLDGNYWTPYTIATDYHSNSYLLLGCNNGLHPFKIGIGTDTFKFPNYLTADVLVKFDSSGNVLCGSIFTEGNEDDGDGMNASPSGQYIYTTGDISFTGIFGMDTMDSYSVEQFFIASWKSCDSNIETGIYTTASDSKLKIFPNPSNGRFTLSIFNLNGKFNVDIYDMMGQKVYAEACQTATNVPVNIISEPNGVYLCRVLKEDGSIIGQGKIVIEK